MRSILNTIYIINTNVRDHDCHHIPVIIVLTLYLPISYLLTSQYWQFFLKLLDASKHFFYTCPFHLFRNANIDTILFAQSDIFLNVTF